MAIILDLIIMLSYSSGMYLGDDKIGYTIMDITPKAEGYILKEELVMKVGMIGEERSMEVSSVYTLDREYRLQKFTFQLDTYTQSFSSSGEVGDNTLSYRVKTGGKETENKMNLSGDLYVPQSIPLVVAAGRISQPISVFDPTMLAVNEAEVTILDDRGDSIKYKTEILGAQSVTWVDGDGAVIRSDEPMGVKVLRESREEVERFGEKSPEILSMFSIPAGMAIKNPRECVYLKAIVDGRFKVTQRQKVYGDTLIVEAIYPDIQVIKRYPLPLFGCSCTKTHRVPEELKRYLEATPLIQTNDSDIRSTSKRIVRGAKDDWEKVVKITHWVSQNIEDCPSATIPSALDVLKTLKGDCNEHATLFCALSRAAGIPSDISVGVVYMKGNFYYHAWNKAWISTSNDEGGMWIEVDPTFNQTTADATHITLEEGGLKDWAKIMDLVGNIKIKVIEYK